MAPTPTKSQRAAADLGKGLDGLKISTSTGDVQAVGYAHLQPNWQGPNAVSSGEHPFNREGVSPTCKPNKLHGAATTFEPKSGPLGSRVSPITMLNFGSIADQSNGGPVIVQSKPASKGKDKATDYAPVGTHSGNITPPDSAGTEVFFSTNSSPGGWVGTHFVKIDGIHPGDYDKYMSILMNEFKWKVKLADQKVPQWNASKKEMTSYLCFDDIRECETARRNAALLNPNWVVSYCDHAEYATVAASTQLGSQTEIGPFDSHIIYEAQFDGNWADLRDVDFTFISDQVSELAADFGDMVTFEKGQSATSRGIEFRAEYCSYAAASEVLRCVTHLEPATYKKWVVVAFKVEATEYPMHGVAHSPNTPRRFIANGKTQIYSPTGRTAWSYNTNGEEVVEKPAITVPKVGASGPSQWVGTPVRDRYFSAPNPITSYEFDRTVIYPRSASYPGHKSDTSETEPQTVVPAKIESGQDVRTTIMLRNLPNRWTCDDIKRILDQTTPGQYDFSYLRIDFEWNTNVGYAFVNFIDPMSIVKFFRRFHKNEWSPGHFPLKEGAISYATVQGYDCLVEKFRNSSIMDEYPGFRPKLWYTPESAPDPSVVGQEKPFPPPNNASKKQRSHDNAGTVGLFAPNRGPRHSDRARRSNFDRGTPRQLQEDAQYNGQFGQLPRVGYNHNMNGVYANAMQPPIGPPAFQQPFYGGYGGYGAPQVHGFNDAFIPYVFPQAPYYNGYAAYPVPAPAFNGHRSVHAYVPNNPSSSMRTMSGGRLAGRPRNVTVQPGNGGIATNGLSPNVQPTGYAVPRTFSVNHGQHLANGGVEYGGPGPVGNSQGQQY